MNTHSEIVTLPAPDPTAAEAGAPLRSRRSGHRRTGKVAVLSKITRDKINAAIDDGVPYARIIDSLGPEAAGLTTHNISEWKDGGYQDYLDDEFWRDEMRARQETFTNMLAGADPIILPEAGLQLAATGACELLRDLCALGDSGSQPDPDQFVRVSNSLARLSRSILTLQQYRDACAKAKSRELKRLETNRDIVEAERTALLDKADDLFGFKSHLRLQAELEATRAAATSPAANVGQASLPAGAEASSPRPSPSEFKVQSSAPDPQPQADPPALPPPPNVDSASDEQTADESRPFSQEEELSVASDAGSLKTPEPVFSESLKSEISNLQSSPSSAVDSPSGSPSVAFKVQGSTFEVPSGSSYPPDSSDAPEFKTHSPSTKTPESPAIENQKPKTKSSNDRCYACQVRLPSLLPDGRRPHRSCRACGARLYPPGTLFDHCQFCGTAHPVLPDNQRPDSTCRRCQATLPPPGQRFVTRCPACGIPANIDTRGKRLSKICHDCRAPLPLLEPATPPSPYPWP